MVTINDIAKVSGFSASTVSRALADIELIPLETRSKIKLIASQMGYSPNIAAKNLKTKKAWNIGIISFVEEKLGFSHYLFANILENFIKVVDEKNYDITLLSRKFLNNESDLVAHCRGRNLDGVLILCADASVLQIRNLIESTIPVVIIDNFDEKLSQAASCITSDNRVKMFELTDYIISMGHKKIVYITGQDIFVTSERIKGYKAALKSNNIDFEEDMLVESFYYNLEYSKKKVLEVLERKVLPTCIIMPDDYCAVKAYEILKSKGLQVGKDISVAGFDGLEISQHISPRLTTVFQDAEKIGETAAETLLASINKTENRYLKIVPAKFIRGESVGKISD